LKEIKLETWEMIVNARTRKSGSHEGKEGKDELDSFNLGSFKLKTRQRSAGCTLLLAAKLYVAP
jgi:hypothetical protein